MRNSDMKSFRFNSLNTNGLGGPEATAISLVYSFLLTEYKATSYSKIFVNQIDESNDEVIVKFSSKDIHMNILYKTPDVDPNCARLEIIHSALLKLSSYENKVDPFKLKEIHQRILDNDFNFKFILKEFRSHRVERKAWLVVEPQEKQFNYYIRFNLNGQEFERLLFVGLPEIFYADYFFGKCNWLVEDILELTGSMNEVKILVNLATQTFVVNNLTEFQNPPYFQLMRADISQEERDSANEDWEKTLAT